MPACRQSTRIAKSSISHVGRPPGAEPTIVVMHGFPDNLHLYDRLLPHLSPPRRVVTFDFLGWAIRINRPATLTPRTIKSATSTPSSHN
jgi:pimeloyl-ACP methyl ester carboxylesterase